MTDRREIGPDQIKALTHPIRVRLLKELRSNGPATATLLAKRLGESSGVTSYHLRQLERHGFVEEASDVGDGRDRWWRPAFDGHHVRTEKWIDDPENAAVVSMYESNVVDVHSRSAYEWVSTQSDWPAEWVEASALNDYRFRLTQKQFSRLTHAVHDLISSFEKHDAKGTDAQDVYVVFQAFPRTRRPFTEEES